MYSISKRFTTIIIVTILSVVFYFSFAYHLERTQFLELFSLCVALFILTYLLIEKLNLNYGVLIGLGIFFRLIFIAAIPNLSQDFYRFLWDGRLVAQGISPYLFTPDMYLAQISKTIGDVIPQADELYTGMGPLSASNYSSYPPMNQFFFATAALLGGKSILGSVVVLRSIIIIADLGILYFGKKILEKLGLPFKNIFWFFLNPFIIIELSGNLHFEGAMLVFLNWTLFLLFRGKWAWAALLIGISISVKLIPLMLLPIFIKFLSKNDKIIKSSEPSLKKLLGFYVIIGLSVLLTFLPFLSVDFIKNFTFTIGLWFQKFEFNASVYYLIRWIGFKIVGWNIIETVGKILPLVTFLCILVISFFRRNMNLKHLIQSMLFAVSIYLMLSTTVHPWYITTPLILSVFTNYKFPLVWSLMIFLSYSAYGNEGVNENLLLVAIEYITIISIALWEISRSKGNLKLENSNDKHIV